MNTLTMTGNLTKDPELVERDGRAICELCLAVDNGRHPTTHIDVSTFDDHAYACAECLHKGCKVGVSGRLALDEWQSAENKRRWRYSVIGRVEFLDRPRAEVGVRTASPNRGPPTAAAKWAPSPSSPSLSEPEAPRGERPLPILARLRRAFGRGSLARRGRAGPEEIDDDHEQPQPP